LVQESVLEQVYAAFAERGTLWKIEAHWCPGWGFGTTWCKFCVIICN